MHPASKIFVIGYNKTATTTIHHLFLSNGLKSFHGKDWPLEQYQCFSDMTSGSTQWRDCYDQHPGSLFILNTRCFDDWILSRVKHCKAHRDRWGYPPTLELITKWIEHRQQHYLEVLRFFEKTPERLIIVSINRPRWLEFLSQQLKLTPYQINKNIRRDSLFKKDFLERVRRLTVGAFQELKVSPDEGRSEFLARSLLSDSDRSEVDRLLSLFRHNLE
jgi:hypothetical protein